MINIIGTLLSTTYFLIFKMYYFVFDTETNGLPEGKKMKADFSNVYLYQLAYYKYDLDLQLYSKINLFVNLDDYANFKYIEKNKIMEEDLRTKGKKIKNILNFLNKKLDDVCLLVAHNLDFDINVLLTEAKRNENFELYNKLLTIPKFDTMRVAGCLGLKLLNKPYPSQEDVYNFLFYNQLPIKKSSKYQILTLDEIQQNKLNDLSIQEEKNKVEHYSTLHDADDDTKHCGEIFCKLIKDWDKCIIKFGKFKNLNIPFWKQSFNMQLWALNKYYENLKVFKTDNIDHNQCYYQTYFTDFTNYIKYKNPKYIKNIDDVKIEIKKDKPKNFNCWSDDESETNQQYEDYKD